MKFAISLHKYGTWPIGKLVGGDVDSPTIPFKPSMCLELIIYCSLASHIAGVFISLADKKTTKDMTRRSNLLENAQIDSFLLVALPAFQNNVEPAANLAESDRLQAKLKLTRKGFLTNTVKTNL